MIKIKISLFLVMVGLFVAPALFMPGHPGEMPDGDVPLARQATIPYFPPPAPMPDGGMPPRGGTEGVAPLRRNVAVLPVGAVGADAPGDVGE